MSLRNKISSRNLCATRPLADSSGTIQTQYTFDPFGNTTPSGSSTTNSFAYTGRELDATGLYFYRARYYSAGLQRFVSEDPLDGLGIENEYTYASDDPVDLVDPSGLSDLLFLRASQTIILLDGNGWIVGTYPAGNNVDSHAPWGNGISYFPRPGCDYCGVHSGQENRPDDLQRIGPQHATRGCIRTTDDATRKILDLKNAGDPLKHLYVR